MAVQTFGIPSEEDQQQELVNSSPPLAGQPESITGTTDSALPPSTQATNGAPLPGADVQDGGAEPALQAMDKPAGPARGERDLMKEAGTPTDQIKNMDGAKLVSTSERVLKEIKKARKGANPELLIGQGKQLNETLGATGASVDKAGEQWLEESEKSIDHDVVDGVYTKSEGKKKKFALRNIYSKIAPEEMGLFLMDFGLRAMMAGESMGTLGALGAAGSGALGALGERRAANEAKAVEDYKYSQDQELKERELDIKAREKPPTLTETIDGFVYWDETLNDGAGGWAEAKVGDKKMQPPLSSANRPFAPAALAEQLKQSGFFSDQDVAILAAKQPGRGQIKKDAMDAWERRMNEKTYPTNPATGRSFSSTEWKQVPTAERERYRSEYTERYVNEYLSVYEKSISDEEAAAAAQNALSQVK